MAKKRAITVMAHRGYSAKYPENTMLAFEKALEAGADGIELDVHVTKDGELVIIHDESLDRTTDGTGTINTHTLAELKDLNAAANFTGVDYAGIPTLSEYLMWAKDKNIYTNIELKNNKTYYGGLEELAAGMVKRFGLTKKVIFSSFNHVSLSRLKKLLPEVPMGILCKKPLVNVGEYVKACGVDYLHPESTYMVERVIKNCRKHEVPINVWEVNNEEAMMRMLELGVDGLITDEPELAKKTVMKYLAPADMIGGPEL
ncbi:glycerophosphodiester phosphodiesterase [Anaerolentibacter hominis]|uniref:glycerophosphodiester phosphodiesterase n=1 Tax=Anaerolentibacter hominis TaxID=3079009 RepID=UPI0031B8ADE5